MKLIIFAISLIIACEAFSVTSNHAKHSQVKHKSSHVAVSKRENSFCDQLCSICPAVKRHNSHKKTHNVHNKKHHSVRDGEELNTTPDILPYITTLCNECECNGITESTENPEISTPESNDNQNQQNPAPQKRHGNSKKHHNVKAHHTKHEVNKTNHH